MPVIDNCSCCDSSAYCNSGNAADNNVSYLVGNDDLDAFFIYAGP